jgi:hypothetical protein
MPSQPKTVVMQPWIGRDRWSGPEDLMPSLHLTQADRDAYLEPIYVERHLDKGAPEYYESAEKPAVNILVDAALYNKLRRARAKGQFGIRVPVIAVYSELRRAKKVRVRVKAR